MGTDGRFISPGMDAAVQVNHIVVADILEASLLVPGPDITYSRVSPLRSRAAMDNDLSYLPHFCLAV